MKYLVSLMQIIIIVCFLCPVESFAKCNETNKQYNVIDIIIGKNINDLIDCMNKVMENTTEIYTSSSVTKLSNYYSSATSPQMKSNRSIKPQIDHDGDKIYNYHRKNEVMGIASSPQTTNKDALVFCH